MNCACGTDNEENVDRTVPTISTDDAELWIYEPCMTNMMNLDTSKLLVWPKFKRNIFLLADTCKIESHAGMYFDQNRK